MKWSLFLLVTKHHHRRSHEHLLSGLKELPGGHETSDIKVGHVNERGRTHNNGAHLICLGEGTGGGAALMTDVTSKESKGLRALSSLATDRHRAFPAAAPHAGWWRWQRVSQRRYVGSAFSRALVQRVLNKTYDRLAYDGQPVSAKM